MDELSSGKIESDHRRFGNNQKIGNSIFFGQKPQRFFKFCIIRFVITKVESFICGIIELTISSIIEFSYFSIEDTLGAP